MKHRREAGRARHQQRHGERGATATEYALLVSFIALVLVTGVTLFGGNLNTTFEGFGDFIANNI